MQLKMELLDQNLLLDNFKRELEKSTSDVETINAKAALLPP